MIYRIWDWIDWYIVRIIEYLIITTFRLFKNEDEIVIHMMKKLTPSEREYIKSTPKEKLILLHSGVGRNIRNHYWLWDKQNPYTQYTNGSDANHPDNMSYRILNRIWVELQDKL